MTMFSSLLASAVVPADTAVRLSPGLGVDAASLLRLVISLALVLGAIVLVARVFKQVGMRGTNNGQLRVASVVSLGPKERIVLLDVGERQLLVGVAPGGISRLESLDQPLKDLGADKPATGDFRQVLRQVLGK